MILPNHNYLTPSHSFAKRFFCSLARQGQTQGGRIEKGVRQTEGFESGPAGGIP